MLCSSSSPRESRLTWSTRSDMQTRGKQREVRSREEERTEGKDNQQSRKEKLGSAWSTGQEIDGKERVLMFVFFSTADRQKKKKTRKKQPSTNTLGRERRRSARWLEKKKNSSKNSSSGPSQSPLVSSLSASISAAKALVSYPRHSLHFVRFPPPLPSRVAPAEHCS